MEEKNRQRMAAYYADRRRAATAWQVFLTSEHMPDRSVEVLTELVDSATEEGRLDRLLYAILHVARDIVPQLHTSARSELFAVTANRYANLEADVNAPDSEPGKPDASLVQWLEDWRRRDERGE
ncbi:hypothetical protein [Rhodococcus sp. IEGM 1330]|uniref:hypothetical protein n=1 Tax=Rhodococcus sp. IEGM 1330 TaxID=3082225 RepID=UPI0029554995|nr:hypothetical protein [Rhodococcus sp. IEGM 1330]MDV8024002.1 hypothetical protein [Rhodococcus sp. IEGM 1330]